MAFDLDDEELKATRILNGTDKGTDTNVGGINAGEYVRLRNGYIDKVIIDYKGKCNNPNCPLKHISCEYNFYDEDEITKHSKNIIDLIEVGDIVNQKLISNVDKVDKIHLLEFEDGDMYKTDILNDKFIKSILTHEKYEQNCYRLGE